MCVYTCICIIACAIEDDKLTKKALYLRNHLAKASWDYLSKVPLALKLGVKEALMAHIQMDAVKAM